MGIVKDIWIEPIDAKIANRFVKKTHYSGKDVQNSQLHLGAFFEQTPARVLQLGPSIDKRKLIGLVKSTGWNEFIELNRLAFDDHLPKNSESRAIAVAMKLLRKYAPQIRWVVSFADGAQCGDGTIYRAAGFVLTGIRESISLFRAPNGEVIHKVTLESSPMMPRPEGGGKSYFDITGGRYNFRGYVQKIGGEILTGYQLRYIYFVDKGAKKDLTVPVIPYSRIKEMGASMYKGQRPAGETVSHPVIQLGGGGSTPTAGLTNKTTGRSERRQT